MFSVPHTMGEQPGHPVDQGLRHSVQVGAGDEGVVVEHLVTQHQG